MHEFNHVDIAALDTSLIPRVAPRLRMEAVLIAPPAVSKFAYSVDRLTEAIEQAAGIRTHSLRCETE